MALHMYIKLTTYRIQDTGYRIQNTRETQAHKITNVPLLYIAPGLNDFDRGKSITWAIGRAVGMVLATLLTISGPNPFQWSSNGFASIKIITPRAIQTTVTSIVILYSAIKLFFSAQLALCAIL